MKATLFAAVLLLSIVSLSVEAAVPNNSAPASSPPVVKTLPKININTADVSALTQSFKGIGKKRAEAIVHYRETHGAFKSVADLAAVRGLGETFVSAHLAALQLVFSVN